jgi:hypothetical protein
LDLILLKNTSELVGSRLSIKYDMEDALSDIEIINKLFGSEIYNYRYNEEYDF